MNCSGGNACNARFLLVIIVGLLLLGCLSMISVNDVRTQGTTAVVFENLRVCNGTADQLSALTKVLVVDNVLTAISSGPRKRERYPNLLRRKNHVNSATTRWRLSGQ